MVDRADTSFVHFPFDQSELTPQAKSVVRGILTFYRSTEERTPLILRGHCDAIGSHEYNDKLSQKRVAAVKKYLIELGLPADSIADARGFGKREPVYESLADEDREINRRVEIIWNYKEKFPETKMIIEEDTLKTLKQEIDSIKAGENLRLKNINFYGGRHTFLPESYPALQELLDVMKANPTLVIEIQGYICCLVGEEDGMDFDANNRHLSLNRAKAVYDYLVENGIDRERMTYKGFAGTKLLIYPELTEAHRTTNRRVEIRIISK